MWNIKHLSIKNICTLKDIDYTFTQGITTLLFGNNIDNEGQKNNGSGKSALIEAIVFGLIGNPLRQVKNEELINNDEESAYIKIILEDNANTEVAIERTIYRKGSPDITVTMYRNGELVDDGSTVKSGVDEYNKYILDLIGLSKEEIYNSYVLSKHKYQDFLSASDKEKKEIINKFSNGNLIDQSILAVQADTKPLLELFDKTKLELSNYDGRISAIEEQIQNEKTNSKTKQQTKEQRIQEANSKIAEHKQAINELKSKISDEKQNQKSLNKISEEFNNLEDSRQELSSDQILDRAKTILSNTNLLSYDFDNFKETKVQFSEQIKLYNNELGKLELERSNLDATIVTAKKLEQLCRDNYNEKKSVYDKFILELKNKINLFCQRKTELDSQIQILRSKIQSNTSLISELKAKLSGSIECPHCSKTFILEDKNFDIEQAKSNIQIYIKSNISLQDKIEKHIKELNMIEKSTDVLKQNKIEKQISVDESLQKIKEAERNTHNKEDDLLLVNRKINKITTSIKDLEEKQTHSIDNLFDDIFENLSRSFSKLANSIKTSSESISNFEGLIKAKEELIDKLNQETEESIISSLQESLKEYKKKRTLVYKQQNTLDEQIKTLNTQEARFIAFKTYLANSKVEALNEITNDFLEQIGSDLRVRFDGYTMLKSGKVRDKISVSLLRNGIDVGSFAKFSEGEKTRIQLATILAMHTLTNNNADHDKGLNLLVLDEILAAVDEEGLAFILESLNKLKITSLVVSHGKTAESYPYKLVITKQNGISTIGQSH